MRITNLFLKFLGQHRFQTLCSIVFIKIFILDNLPFLNFYPGYTVTTAEKFQKMDLTLPLRSKSSTGKEGENTPGTHALLTAHLGRGDLQPWQTGAESARSPESALCLLLPCPKMPVKLRHQMGL